jgi:hypothetical protein
MWCGEYGWKTASGRPPNSNLPACPRECVACQENHVPKRGTNSFKLTDAARAIRAARAAGFKRPRLEITAGKIAVIDDGERAPDDHETDDRNEVEDWITKNAHQG